jgi:PEP-CTERM motif
MRIRSSTCHPVAPISSMILTLILLGIPIRALATPIAIQSATGADAASILGVVDLFRADVSSGGVNNGNTVGSLPTGRREINWDGGGAAALATTFTSPMNTFNSGATTRGLVSTTAGTGFEISGQPSPEFGDINATYPGIFQTFSTPRLFAPLGSNVMDVLFFSPGTNIPASVFGFGAVFTDVDFANTSSLEFFNTSNVSLGTFFVPALNNGLSFLGVTFTDAIGRVRITTGNAALGPNDGGATDVVALDDFIYSEPQVVPEPSTLLLAGAGVAAIARARRRSRA